MTVIVALGSNLGDRAQILQSAVRAIAEIDGVELTGISPVIETEALTLDDREAPAYLNGVVSLTTTLTAETLLDALQAIEQDHGRVRLQRWGDRTLDLDIIVFGDEAIVSERLTVPHPEAHLRTFVLAPWAALDPDALLPGHGAVRDLLAGLESA